MFRTNVTIRNKGERCPPLPCPVIAVPGVPGQAVFPTSVPSQLPPSAPLSNGPAPLTPPSCPCPPAMSLTKTVVEVLTDSAGKETEVALDSITHIGQKIKYYLEVCNDSCIEGAVLENIVIEDKRFVYTIMSSCDVKTHVPDVFESKCVGKSLKLGECCHATLTHVINQTDLDFPDFVTVPSTDPCKLDTDVCGISNRFSATANLKLASVASAPIFVPITVTGELSISKTYTVNGVAGVDLEYAAVGDVIKFTVTITNDTNVKVLSYDFFDVLTVAGDNKCCPITIQQDTPISGGILCPGETEVFGFELEDHDFCNSRYIVTQADVDCCIGIKNTASVKNAVWQCGTVPLAKDVVVHLNRKPAGTVDVQKSYTLFREIDDDEQAVSPPFQAGDHIRFVVIVTNNTNATLDSITLKDTLSLHVGTDCDPAIIEDFLDITDPLEPGDSFTIGPGAGYEFDKNSEYKVTEEDVRCCLPICNVAEVTAAHWICGDLDGDLEAAQLGTSNEVCVNGGSACELTIEVVMDNSVQSPDNAKAFCGIGQVIPYTVTITNTSATATIADGLVITRSLPTPLYLGVTPDPLGPGDTYVLSAQTVTTVSHFPLVLEVVVTGPSSNANCPCTQTGRDIIVEDCVGEFSFTVDKTCVGVFEADGETLVSGPDSCCFSAKDQIIKYVIHIEVPASSGTPQFDANNVVVQDANADGGPTQCSYAQIVTGSSKDCHVQHTVTQADIDVGFIDNSAEVCGEDSRVVARKGTVPAGGAGAEVDFVEDSLAFVSGSILEGDVVYDALGVKIGVVQSNNPNLTIKLSNAILESTGDFFFHHRKCMTTNIVHSVLCVEEKPKCQILLCETVCDDFKGGNSECAPNALYAVGARQQSPQSGCCRPNNSCSALMVLPCTCFKYWFAFIVEAGVSRFSVNVCESATIVPGSGSIPLCTSVLPLRPKTIADPSMGGEKTLQAIMYNDLCEPIFYGSVFESESDKALIVKFNNVMITSTAADRTFYVSVMWQMGNNCPGEDECECSSRCDRAQLVDPCHPPCFMYSFKGRYQAAQVAGTSVRERSIAMVPKSKEVDAVAPRQGTRPTPTQPGGSSGSSCPSSGGCDACCCCEECLAEGVQCCSEYILLCPSAAACEACMLTLPANNCPVVL
jgi:uncharacterized repeat protein (TIGR01451 family)